MSRVLDSSFQDIEAADAGAKPRTAAGARIRLASPADVPFIVGAIASESRHGHFSCDCDRPDVLRGLWHQVGRIVAEGCTPLPGERNGAAGRAFIIQVGPVDAGFAILVEQALGSWQECVELFAMATTAAFRGRGLGRQLVRGLTRESRSAAVRARCAPASKAMTALLVSCGYVAVGQSMEGTLTLEYRRAGRAAVGIAAACTPVEPGTEKA